MPPHTITEHIEGAGHAGKKRSLVKTLSWRAIATTDTIIITRLVTGSWAAGAIVGGAEVFTKMFLYYLHERGWSGSDWGLEDVDVDVDSLVGRTSNIKMLPDGPS
jgi:uncharacterized membrane protein